MPLRDRLLAVVVAVCWGLNFPATALGLEHFPPLLMVALRFTLLAIPTLLLVPRPDVPLRWLVGMGLGIGVLQFGFLYLGMAAGMPAGLASLVLQASAPFTVVLAGVWLGQRISPRQTVGIAVAVLGLVAIAAHRAQVAALLPVVLTLCGALGWAFGNVCSAQARTSHPLRLTLWMSVVPPLPMWAISLAVEGPDRVGDALRTALTREALPSVLGLVYVVVVATVVGYGIWTTLMSRHPSGAVAPFSMLVPVTGVAASWVAFGERIDLVVLVAGAAIVGGVLWASRPQRPLTLPPARVSAPPGEVARSASG
ncbi:EamA family transporter [Cellulomonas fimi]|uniref:EamA family transporter n=1 Tax=Cellulomonas fimi TaxID=1708 RepID=A0A7Y0QHN4_CELFI|nr:EamA family transporter [Cellulomonas fimi]NMR19337.1 EamA family transporter [Cellulomonas fimi]